MLCAATSQAVPLLRGPLRQRKSRLAGLRCPGTALGNVSTGEGASRRQGWCLPINATLTSEYQALTAVHGERFAENRTFLCVTKLMCDGTGSARSKADAERLLRYGSSHRTKVATLCSIK